MTFRKLQRFLAAGMVTTMAATTVLGGAPINISRAASKLTAAPASVATGGDTINGVSTDDEGVFKVTMDDTGYITADDDNVAADVNTPFSWDNANVYFVLTDRFYNGDKSNDHSYGRSVGEVDADKYETRIGTFHGGDLKGMTSKLEEGYFDELGTNAIWITAPYEQIHGAMCANVGQGFKHYPYHGYWALDFTEVDANMGTAADLEKFIDTAHEHGIRVIFDIVMNHAGYADPVTAEEYGFGKLASNWRTTYYETSESQYQWDWDYDAETEHGSEHGIMIQSGDWVTNWWGPNWVRALGSRLSGYEGSEQGDDLTLCTDGLPDFKTETTNDPGIPAILKKKWGSNYDTKVSKTKESMDKAGLNASVTGYLAAWLSDWVREYGVDGFRCDTAKHVTVQEWAKLKNACKTALKDWREANPNKPGAQWKDEFWMTGEAWNHGVAKDQYYTSGAFDSMINFSYQGKENNTGASLEATYSDYANKVNSDPDFNILSYISSHDTSLGARSANAGTALLLTPGGVQTYYGDESGRTAVGPGTQGTRSHMNWDSTNTTILSNWQKVGQFRRNHIAVGAGQHKKLDGTNYTFSRTYTGKATVGAETVTDYTDAVVVCLPGKATTTDVTVGDTFGDATTVRDYYSGEMYDIDGDVVKDVKCDSNGVILLEAPADSVSSSTVSASPSGGTYKTDTVEVTLKAKDATETYYQIGDGEKVAYKDGDKVTIGADTAYEEDTVIKLTGKGTDKEGNPADLSKELKFTREKEPEVGVASSGLYVRVKKTDFTTAPQIYVYDTTHQEANAYTGAWPGVAMTEEGDYYVYQNDEITTAVKAIVFTADQSWRSTPDMGTPDDINGSVELTKGADSGTFKEVVLPTGDKCKVTINYIDKVADKTIKSIYRVGLEGDDYKTYEGSFAGYTLIEKPENATGKFTKDEITVNYYYTTGDTPVTIPPTNIPGTDVPPTQVPGTDVPPTQVPGTDVPPTQVPGTDVPPTQIPGTDVPPTQIPPTDVPPTPVPLSVKAFTSSAASPQTLGSTVTFKASGQGGSGSYQYKFEVYRIVNSVKAPALKQAYSTTDTLKWTPDIAGNYQVTVRVKDTKSGDVKTASVTYVINAKSTGTGSKKLSISKFTIAHTTGKYAVKLSAAATGGTGTKQFKFVRVYTSKGKLKYKVLKSFSSTKTTKWKAPKKNTYKFRVYVKDKKGLKVQLTKTFKVTK